MLQIARQIARHWPVDLLLKLRLSFDSDTEVATKCATYFPIILLPLQGPTAAVAALSHCESPVNKAWLSAF